MARIEERFGYRDTCEQESMNEGRLYIIYMRGSEEESVVAVVYAPRRPLLSGNQFFPPNPLLAPVRHDGDGEKVTELNGIASLGSPG